MKKTFVSSTSLLMLLTEIPLIAVLVLAIIFNDRAGAFPKLYPLIIATSLGIVFIFIYLFKLIIISYEEIKIIGRFSSQDKAIINKGKTLILTLRERGRLIITLFGNDGERPAFDWTQGEDYTPVDINLFREKAEGGERSVRKILSYFEIPKVDVDAILTEDGFTGEYESFNVWTEKLEGKRNVYLKFTKTV